MYYVTTDAIVTFWYWRFTASIEREKRLFLPWPCKAKQSRRIMTTECWPDLCTKMLAKRQTGRATFSGTGVLPWVALHTDLLTQPPGPETLSLKARSTPIRAVSVLRWISSRAREGEGRGGKGGKSADRAGKLRTGFPSSRNVRAELATEVSDCCAAHAHGSVLMDASSGDIPAQVTLYLDRAPVRQAFRSCMHSMYVLTSADQSTLNSRPAGGQ